MKKNKCIKCGISQVEHQQIFLTIDGYCTVCNHKYKDRPRTKSIFEFKTIKKGSYNHLNRHGRARTKDSDMHEKISSKNRAMVIPLLYTNYKKKQNKKIDTYL